MSARRDEADDLEIVTLCAEHAHLSERLVNMTSERDAYRELALQAIHELHDRDVELNTVIRRHYSLVNQYRELRQALLADSDQRPAA